MRVYNQFVGYSLLWLCSLCLFIFLNILIKIIMARYSSDSDSDRSSKHRRKYYGRSRSSSLESSDSSSYKRKSSKHSKTKRRHRSRSRSRDRDRSSKSYKYSRESSRDRERRKQKSRRSRSQSSNHKKQRRSTSREKSTSRSSSIAKPIVTEKVQVFPKDEFSIAPNIKEEILDEINSEGFAPKQFISYAQNKESKPKPIVIDITADTIHVPPVTTIIQSDSIFHTSIMGDQDGRFDKWVKKLYLIRQKSQPETVN